MSDPDRDVIDYPFSVRNARWRTWLRVRTPNVLYDRLGLVVQDDQAPVDRDPWAVEFDALRVNPWPCGLGDTPAHFQKTREPLIRPLLLILALAVVACGSSTAAEDSARRDSLVQAVSSAASCEVIDVHAVLGGDWDRAVFLGPYATNQGAKEALGFDFDVEKVSPWASTEGGMVVVLAKGQQAIAWFGLPSTEVGLAGLDYASLEAAQLTFAVAVDGSGARRLVPQGTAGC